MEKVKFSKFFPETRSYITVSGKAKGSDDFEVSLDISDGSDRISFFATEWDKSGDTIKFLESVRQAVEATIAFQQKAMGLKPTKGDKALGNWENFFDKVVEKKPAAKKKPEGSKPASKKKPAGSKKVVK
jgi:hypothetical protein